MPTNQMLIFTIISFGQFIFVFEVSRLEISRDLLDYGRMQLPVHSQAVDVRLKLMNQQMKHNRWYFDQQRKLILLVRYSFSIWNRIRIIQQLSGVYQVNLLSMKMSLSKRIMVVHQHQGTFLHVQFLEMSKSNGHLLRHRVIRLPIINQKSTINHPVLKFQRIKLHMQHRMSTQMVLDIHFKCQHVIETIKENQFVQIAMKENRLF